MWVGFFFLVRTLTKKVSHELPLKKKVVDDILGGAAAWETAERTSSLFLLIIKASPLFFLLIHVFFFCIAVVCEKCGHHEAFFMQIQIRSADEPMTTFYRCANLQCNYIWREG